MRVRLTTIIIVVFLSIASALTVGPIVYLFFMSLKTSGDIWRRPLSLPDILHWENYIYAWQAAKLSRYFINSSIVVVTSVLISTLIASLAAYAFAYHKLKARELLFTLFLMGMMMPPQIMMIPLFNLMRSLGMLNTYQALIGPYVTLGIPLATLIMRGFFESLPREILEAAKIDGASDLRIFWRIMLPLSLPGLGAAMIINTISFWNEFLFALIFMSEEDMYTIPLGLMAFRGEFSVEWAPLAAAILIAIMPLILLITVFQKQFMRGLTAGAIKG